MFSYIFSNLTPIGAVFIAVAFLIQRVIYNERLNKEFRIRLDRLELKIDRLDERLERMV